MIHVCFYCFTVNDWKEKLSRQINKMKNSGLYDAAETIHLFTGGEKSSDEPTPEFESRKKEVESLLTDFPKIELHYSEINYQEGFCALSRICNLSKKEPNSKFLYFHTKGVFNKYKNFKTKEIDEDKIECLSSWVEMLEYFTIENWKDCVEKLEEYELVGMMNYGGWWWGNFWWSSGSYTKNCYDYESGGGRDRWAAEAWLQDSNPNANESKKFQFYPYIIDYGYSKIPRYFYDKSIKKSEININLVKAEYGYFGVQRDEGRMPPVEPVIFDVTNKVQDMIDSIKEIQAGSIFGYDVAPHLDKAQHPIELKIHFNTNIDPKNTYVISTFSLFSINLRDLIL